MVLLHVKGSEREDQFIYECRSSDPVDKITTQVIHIHNFRMRIRRFAHSIQELAKFGPMRTEGQRLLSKKCIEDTMPEAKLPDADLDPNGLRIGQPCPNQIQQVMNKSSQDALAYIDLERTERRQTTSLSELQHHFDCLKGSVMMGFPGGLPDYDPITHIINKTEEDAANIPEIKRQHDPQTAQLWFATRKLMRYDILSDYVGNNEKTKIVVKITKAKGHMPVREPAVDAQTQKHMMAFWHKKQEQDKTLKQDCDTSYLSSEWANPNSLKQAMIGVQDVRFT